jgi:shikimate dehydrogenase
MKLGIIGSPVSHSLSPQIHSFIGQALDLNVQYDRIETSVAALPQRLLELAAQGYLGLNVTAPLKLACTNLVAQSGLEVPVNGSVNTIRFRDKKIQGVANTDLSGFDFLLGPHHPHSVGVLGAGGVLPAVLSVLEQRQVSEVVVYNRSPPRSQCGIDQLAGHQKWIWRSIETFGALSSAHDAVIHAMPIHARQSSIGLDWSHLKTKCRFIDLNYGSFANELRTCVRRADGDYSDGLPMLVKQAVESFEFWSGRCVPTRALGDLIRYIRQITPG